MQPSPPPRSASPVPRGAAPVLPPAPPASPASPALAGLTTLRVGGTPRRVAVAETEEQLVGAVAAADAAGERVLLVGGGSNLLVTDGPVEVTAVLVRTRGVEVLEGPGGAGSADGADGHRTLRVAAGEPWDELVALAVRSDLSGVEALSGIPGSTGATPVQNVGAYGQEVADTTTAVRAWCRRERRVVTLTPAQCRFGYRSSVFKEDSDRYVVLSVDFALATSPRSAPLRYPALAAELGEPVGARPPLADVRRAVLALRGRKGMVLDDADPDTWSAGSFFTNPVLDAAAAAGLPEAAPRFDAGGGRVKTSAAWLVEHAGFPRGHGLPGPASLSTKHTLALTNRGGAAAADVLRLAGEVRDGVRAAYGVELVPEPVLVGCSLP